MGRTEPSLGQPPPSFRRDARAKKAKATVSKVIPLLLVTHPRARLGIEASELIVEPKHLHLQLDKSSLKEPQLNRTSQVARLSIRVADTLVAAHSLLYSTSTRGLDLGNTEAKVAILNMASPLSPGGGFLNGASSQEESICMRSTLLPSLRDDYYRLPELGVVYTPDVLIFRDESGEELQKKDRWFVDCASCAMLRLPEIDVGEEGQARYTSDSDRQLVIQKIQMVMKVFQNRGAKKVVLGAWGCGAYKNPVDEIATAFRKVLLGSKQARNGMKTDRSAHWAGIEEIVFAIKDERLAKRFEVAFGEGLLWEEPIHQGAAGGDDAKVGLQEGDPTTVRIQELREKIHEIDCNIAQARSQQLRTGLGSVLATLKAQLEELIVRQDSDRAQEI